MMSSDSANFSEKELNYLKDQQFLLTKNVIAKKIELLLGKIEQRLYPHIQQIEWPEGMRIKSGKISRGELYRGLPYAVLDFPRHFGKEGVCAYRTMFWWGNFFSATWHLSGKYLEGVRSQLLQNAEAIGNSQAYICVNESPWEYHFQEDNYQLAAELSPRQLETIIQEHPFIKISHKWELEQFLELPDRVESTFKSTWSWFQKTNL